MSVCLSVRLWRDLTQFSFFRPFKCSKCGKSFTREATYSSHQCRVQKRQTRVFNGFKTCPVCGIRVRPNALSTHERKHASITAGVCEKCGRHYSRIASLHAHQKRCTGQVSTSRRKTKVQKSNVPQHMDLVYPHLDLSSVEFSEIFKGWSNWLSRWIPDIVLIWIKWILHCYSV